MELKTTGKKLVEEEFPYGLYVWQIEEDGEKKVLGDGEGNVMNVFCTRGDRNALKALADAARAWGYPDGKPVWWGGKRRITDEELEEQQARERWGLTPDPLDIGALRDEAKFKKQNG